MSRNSLLEAGAKSLTLKMGKESDGKKTKKLWGQGLKPKK